MTTCAFFNNVLPIGIIREGEVDFKKTSETNGCCAGMWNMGHKLRFI